MTAGPVDTIDRIFLQAYAYARFFAGSGITRFLCQPPLAKLATRMCQGRVPLCRSQSNTRSSFQKGREERRYGVSGGRGAGVEGPRSAEMAYINHFYFYLWDSEWGAAFWKTNG
jgi:hypothetical protein